MAKARPASQGHQELESIKTVRHAGVAPPEYLNEFARLHLALEDEFEARKHLEMIAQATDEHTPIRSRVISHEVRADYHKLRGEWKEALAAIDTGLELAYGISEQNDLVGELLRRRAWALYELERDDEAFAAAKRSLEVCERVGEVYEIGALFRTLGLLAERRSDYRRGGEPPAQGRRVLSRQGREVRARLQPPGARRLLRARPRHPQARRRPARGLPPHGQRAGPLRRDGHRAAHPGSPRAPGRHHRAPAQQTLHAARRPDPRRAGQGARHHQRRRLDREPARNARHCGALGCRGARHGRNGHRQGAVRPRAAQAERPQGRPRHRQLRGHPRRAHGERALRPPQGLLHRRPSRPRRQVRPGRQGHALPRRDRRPQPAPPGQAAARAAGRHLQPRRRGRGLPRRRPRGQRHQPRPRARRWPRAASAATCSIA